MGRGDFVKLAERRGPCGCALLGLSGYGGGEGRGTDEDLSGTTHPPDASPRSRRSTTRSTHPRSWRNEARKADIVCP